MTADLVLTPGGDLELTADGSLAVEFNHSPAIKRRLTTPVGGYARLVEQDGVWVEVNSNYFSALPELLSLPMTDVEISTLEEAVLDSLQEDSRIEVLEVSKVLGLETADIAVRYVDLQDNSVNVLEA